MPRVPASDALSAIHDQGCAGGVVFAWLDEWFKHNWLVDEFAIPPDRIRRWHNVQNPEQCFGLVKFGRELVAVDGETDDWPARPLASTIQRARISRTPPFPSTTRAPTGRRAGWS